MAGNDLVFWASQPASVFRTITVRPHEAGRLMSFLLDPESPSRAVYEYVVALKDRFRGRNEFIRGHPSGAGYDIFEKIVINAGIVETLFQLAKNPSKIMERVFTSYFAAEGLWELILCGKPAERRTMLQTFFAHDVVEFCLEAVRNGFFIVHRTVAMSGLRILVAQCFLAEYLSVEKTSEIMKTLCQCILSGPDLWVKQLKDSATTWQSLFCFGNIDASTTKARKYAPRYFSLYQEHATWTIIELTFRYPLPEQDHWNKLIRHDPEVLDLIFKCARMPRQPWYAQLEVDVRMAETLVLMLNLPVEMVPGVELEVNDDIIKKRIGARWDGVMEGIGLMTERPGWQKMVTDVWKHIEEEDVEKVNEMLLMAQKNYLATEPYRTTDLMDVMDYRGHCRIATLRLVTTIAFASEQPGNKISDIDLLNLLPIGQAACQVVIVRADLDLEDSSLYEMSEAVERHTSAFHKPGRADPTLFTGKEDCVLQINEEIITGPTCHFRLLIALAKRGLFEKIQQWEAAPKGLEVPGGLDGLKGMVSEKEIKRCLDLSLERTAERRETGNETFRKEKDLDGARFEYWSAAQLAAALVRFDQATNGRYHGNVKGARKELVLNLGNAAEMSLGQGFFDRALVFAEAAVRLAAETVKVSRDGEDAIGAGVLEKNERRIERARAGLQGKRSKSG